MREVLTELGLDFVARQVEPWPEQRAALLERSGSDLIPALETEDGRFFHGTRAIFGYLQEREPWEHADAHRRRFLDHRDARESDAPGRLVEYFRASPGRRAGRGADRRERARGLALRAARRRPDDRRGRLPAPERPDRASSTPRSTRRSRAAGSAAGWSRPRSTTRAAKGSRSCRCARSSPAYIDRHPEYQDIVAADYRNH